MAKRKPRTFDHLPFVSRQQAFDAGDKQYFTGESCDHGHVAPRTTHNGQCIVCRRDYWLAWQKRTYENRAEEFRTRVRKHLAKDPIGVMLRGVKGRANVRGIPFSLTRDDISIPENCPCCSRNLSKRTGEFKKGAVPTSPSLDRIKPELGYVSGNVTVICFRCNSLKNNATLEELETVVRWIKSIRPGQLKLVV